MNIQRHKCATPYIHIHGEQLKERRDEKRVKDREYSMAGKYGKHEVDMYAYGALKEATTHERTSLGKMAESPDFFSCRFFSFIHFTSTAFAIVVVASSSSSYFYLVAPFLL